MYQFSCSILQITRHAAAVCDNASRHSRNDGVIVDGRAVLESVPTVLTQPGTPVSFRGMCIYLRFDFRKLRNFRCFPFPENSGTPTFPFSGNSGLRRFWLLVIRSCISPFTCDSVVSPCFMYYPRLCTQVSSLYPVNLVPLLSL